MQYFSCRSVLPSTGMVAEWPRTFFLSLQFRSHMPGASKSLSSHAHSAYFFSFFTLCRSWSPPRSSTGSGGLETADFCWCGDYTSSGPSRLTCLARKALPGVYAPASIALRVIEKRKPPLRDKEVVLEEAFCLLIFLKTSKLKTKSRKREKTGSA
jgi:hypothetical protein